MGAAGTDGVNLGDDAGEHAAGALNLNTGLDNILNRGDTHGLAGLCNIEVDGLQILAYVVVLVNELLNLIGVDVQNAVFHGTFV